MHLSPSLHPSAQALLGRGHPMAIAEERIRWLSRQEAVSTVLLVGSAAALVAGAHGLLAIVLAAAAVQLALAFGLWASLETRRRRARELIVAGCASLPLPAVQREGRRLLRRAGALAASLDRMRVEASQRPQSIIAPLYVRSVIRAVDDDLAGAARLLRGASPDVAAVARAEDLLGGEGSPLYGEDVRRLREELSRLRFALSARAAQ